jgi:putative heme transporter
VPAERESPLSPSPPPPLGDHPGSVRGLLRAHRRGVAALVALIVVVGFVLVVLPQIAGFGTTLHRLRHGDTWWLVFGILLETISIGGYVVLFRTVFSCEGTRVGWSASYQITMAGVVATKLLAAAGAGGVALTVWALRAAGLDGRTVARRMAAFEVLLYSVYMGSLVVFGAALATGVLSGRAPGSLTILPAGFGGAVILGVLSFKLVPGDIDHRARRLTDLPPRLRRLLGRVSTLPRTVRDGVTTALQVVSRPRVGLLGAFAYWGFDIATLWAAFRAFGSSPPLGIIVMAYFVGMLANTIPLPGGIGAVEGGMIGAFLAFGVNGSTAILAVLAYRAISFWLPTLPGLVAYLQLRRTVADWHEQEPAEDAAAPVPTRGV